MAGRFMIFSLSLAVLAQGSFGQLLRDNSFARRTYVALSTDGHLEQSVNVHSQQAEFDPLSVYLDIVRDALTGELLETPSVAPAAGNAQELARGTYKEVVRQQGADWCDFCYTMAGGIRVQNVRDLVQSTISENIPGDFLEAGAWRGGCSIMARTVQNAMGAKLSRRTYVCDSFQGLPKASTQVDGNFWAGMHFLQVAQSDVENHFKKFGVLDNNVQFRKGYFSDSMPKLRKEFKESGRKLAVLRGDGDMYESYFDILFNMYEFIPIGGYFICDDCGVPPQHGIAVANHAIQDFRDMHGITEPLVPVAGSFAGMFWQKKADTAVDYGRYLTWNRTRTFNK